MTSIDLSTVPLIATTVVSREVFATMLNPIKVLPSDNDLPRYAFILDLNRYKYAFPKVSYVVTNL